MFPFHYSALNHAVARGTESDSINILGNQLQEKMKADSMVYMAPIFDFSSSMTDLLSPFSFNSPLNVGANINAYLTAYQNGTWQCNQGFGGFGGFNFGGIGNGFNFGNMFGGNWGNFGNNNTNGTSTGSSELDALKALITKYKEIGEKNCSLSPSLKDKITNTLNKSGSTEEKLTALKDLYKILDKSKLEQAMLQMTEYKEMLTEAGYDFKSSNREKDAELKKELNTLEQNIKGKGDQLTLLTGGENDPSILRKISYWNDTHKDANNRSILRLIADNIPSKEAEQTQYKIGVKNLSMSLINKVEDFKASASGEFTKLDKAKNEVSDALSKAEKDFTKNNITDLAKKFETLYAMLRILEAEKTRNAIKAKFSFLNNIASDDKDFVTDNLIVAETKADLKKEGISFNESDIDEIKQDAIEDYTDIDDKCDTPEEKVKALMADDTKALAKTSKDGVYKSTATNTNEPVKHYVIKDDKLVELKGVKSIDKNGMCTKVDGKQVSLEQAKKDAVEVTAQDIINYKNTVDMVNKLVVNGTLIKCKGNGMPAGTQLYKSKGIEENGYPQYFIVKDGSLKQIDCKFKGIDGKFRMNDGRVINFAQLTDNEFLNVGESDINTKNKKAEAAKKKAEDKKAEEKEKADAENATLGKKYEAPEISDSDKETGAQIAKDLMGNTDDNEWDTAINDNIGSMNADNVRSILKGYNDEKNMFTDDILTQIVTEQCNTGWFGEMNQELRPADERLNAIKNVIKAVLDHCDKYGVTNDTVYKSLKTSYSTMATGNLTTENTKKWDGYIKRLLRL